MKKLKWDKMTDLPEFDNAILHPEDEYKHHYMYLQEMPTDSYIKLQLKRKPALQIKDEKFMEYDYPRLNKKNTNYPNGISTPVIEVDTYGNLTTWQEGYRRGLYAQAKKQRTLPVWFAVQRQFGLEDKIKRKEYDAFED